jgi:hypothetical protein
MPAKTKTVKRPQDVADARKARQLAGDVLRLGKSIMKKNDTDRPGYVHRAAQHALENVGTARIALLEIARGIGDVLDAVVPPPKGRRSRCRARRSPRDVPRDAAHALRSYCGTHAPSSAGEQDRSGDRRGVLRGEEGTAMTKKRAKVEVLLSPKLRKDTRWTRSVQKAVGQYMAKTLGPVATIRPQLDAPTFGRNSGVRAPVCANHPRAGRDVDVTSRRVVISCVRCARRLLLVRGPFKTMVANP